MMVNTKKILSHYLKLMRLDKPIGILLLLWPTLWGLWFAGAGRPDFFIVAIFICGVVLMRSAGCVINDYADRNIDPHVTRTRARPIAAGDIKPRAALILFAALCLLAFTLVLQLNQLTILLSFAALLLAAVYPFMKRYTHLPQFMLGVAFAWGIIMAFAAQTNSVPLLAWIVFAANICWSIAYDTAYAVVDRDDDINIGVKSTAIIFGRATRSLIGLFHTLCLTLLIVAGLMAQRGTFYYCGISIAALLALYQQHLMRDNSNESYFKSFLHNNYFGAVIFAGLIMDYSIDI